MIKVYSSNTHTCMLSSMQAHTHTDPQSKEDISSLCYLQLLLSHQQHIITNQKEALSTMSFGFLWNLYSTEMVD